MTNEALYKLIETLGDDAKTILIVYLVFHYGSLWVFMGLMTWGIRTLWLKRDSW